MAVGICHGSSSMLGIEIYFRGESHCIGVPTYRSRHSTLASST
jgi:hypothetical protein